tara:strand:+ start:1967 stop:2383 length:417 start_codon:yes stop_codon:yes gene_type:complete
MKIKRIWDQPESPLELHTDERGSIVDIFYNGDIDHIAVIDSEPNVVRGNHYHKYSTQHMLMTKGYLDYWYKPLGSEEPAKVVRAHVGMLVSTPPNEIHALVIGQEGNQFIVFSQGTRGGQDYEADTFRVESIVGPNEN